MTLPAAFSQPQIIGKAVLVHSGRSRGSQRRPSHPGRFTALPPPAPPALSRLIPAARHLVGFAYVLAGTSWQLICTKSVVPPGVLEWHLDTAQVWTVQGLGVRLIWVFDFNCVIWASHLTSLHLSFLKGVSIPVSQSCYGKQEQRCMYFEDFCKSHTMTSTLHKQHCK